MIEYFLPILLFIICLALSAFFSSSEIALISLTRAKVRTLLNDGRKGSESLVTLKETPNRFLISILIGVPAGLLSAAQTFRAGAARVEITPAKDDAIAIKLRPRGQAKKELPSNPFGNP